MLPSGYSLEIDGVEYKDFATGVFIDSERGEGGDAVAAENGNKLITVSRAGQVADLTLMCIVGGDIDKLFDKAEKLYLAGSFKARLFHSVRYTKTTWNDLTRAERKDVIFDTSAYMTTRKSGEFNNNNGENVLINEVHLKG